MLRKLLTAAVAAAGIWAFWRWALPVLTPFLFGFAVAGAVERPVKWLIRRLRFPRRLASLAMTLAIAGAVFGLAYLLVSRALFEAGRLLRQLPDLMAKLPVMSQDINMRIEAAVAAAPPELQEFLRSSADKMLTGGVSLPGELYRWLGNLITGLAAAMPSVLLFSVALSLSVYMFSADYPQAVAFIMRQLPGKWKSGAVRAKDHFLSTLGKWFKAQGILITMNAGLALLGFLALKVEYPLIMVGLIALVDALPVIGSSFVLLPWALFCFITGETQTGFGLMILLAVLSLVRSVSEPRMIGDQIGLHPLVSLLSMYAGFKLMGVWGMLLFPFLAIFITQLRDWGYVKLWK